MLRKIPTALCIDPDHDGFLNLPNCTSWRQAGANELCQSPLDAFPGAPSKCRCDDAFQLPIEVPAAKLDVVKTADPTTINEPGDSVTFKIEVSNKGIDPKNKVTLSSLLDSIYKDITTTGHDGITETTCAIPQTICPGVPEVACLQGEVTGTYKCDFKANVTGNAGGSETDTVTASGIDDRGNSIDGSDSATVTLNDAAPDITIAKTANPTAVLEPGGPITFSIVITNISVSSDPVTINSLTDDIYGDLNGKGDCSVPQTLAGNGGAYSCSFTENVSGNSGDVETDTVTASGADDEGNPVSKSDSATVTVNNVPSKIELIKTANPTSLQEPGGNVTYTYTINNLSSVDTVTINSLTDNILGDLNGQGDCTLPQVLATNGGINSYTCMVIAPAPGDAGSSVTNTATANGIDDDDFEVK